MKSATLVSNFVLSHDHFHSLVFSDLIQQNRPRRDGKNTQKNYTKKYPNDPDNHNGVVSQSEPEILKCELQWVLKSMLPTKQVDVIEFQQSYENLERRCYICAPLNMSENFEKPAVTTRPEKVNAHPSSQEGQY